MRKIEKQDFSIVIIGKLNPEIFQPRWFSAEKLIRKSEGEEAKVKLIHPEVTIFNLDWVKIEVLRERISFHCLQEDKAELIADLVSGTFRILRHTPLTQMGINLRSIFSVKDEKILNGIGDKITPKDIWKNVVKNPGMASVTIQGNRDEDLHKGYIKLILEPYLKQKNSIIVTINDHYEIEKKTMMKLYLLTN